MIKTGSRDETGKENGLAHFIEHLIFKGTKKRKTWHILSRIENVGGELNAFTTKEETAIYASFLSQYYQRTIELFSDVAFNSIFPEKEIEKEKVVITDEINSYNDSPSELIFDDFEDLIFEGHPLGRNILGSVENLKRFTRDDIVNFLKSHYNVKDMVFASVGDIDFGKLIKIMEKYFDKKGVPGSGNKRIPFYGYKPQTKTVKKDSFLSHLILGNIAYSHYDKKKPIMTLLNNILGGPAMNSKLNMAIREKYGFAYQIESYYQPYSDTGVFNVYMGTDKQYIQKGRDMIIKELSKLKKTKMGTLQLQRAKNQFIGQMAISYEVPLNLMLGIAKEYLYKNKIKTFEENVKLIEKITSSELLEIANEIFREDEFSMLVYENKSETE